MIRYSNKHFRAYHEAGHCVVRWQLGGEIKSVSIKPDGKGHFGQAAPSAPFFDDWKDEVTSLLAGVEAERLSFIPSENVEKGNPLLDPDSDESRALAEISEHTIDPKEIDFHLATCRERAFRILRDSEKGLRALVDAIISQPNHYLDGSDAKDFFEGRKRTFRQR